MDAVVDLPKGPSFVLDLVPRESLAAAWPHVSRRIQSFVERSNGRATMETVAQRLASREWQLWLVGNPDTVCGCVLTHAYLADSGMKICEILGCMGDDATQWLYLLDEIEAWAKENGCHRMQAWSRKGWAKRLPDYRLTHVLLEKDL